MLFSFAWLHRLCPVNAGEGEVAEALTARGLTVDAVRGTGDRAVLDVDVPANRPDCLGHLGLAREISAAFGVPLAPPPAAPPGRGEPAERTVRVEVDSPDLCSRYTARVIRGVKVKPSPAWVVRRLEACGLRSRNNVVDASNLVLLELGHPIHTFDLARIAGATIRVRPARPGETLVTLDGVERSLQPGMLLIADAERPVALAGVMGGRDSEIGETTNDVLVEAAVFDRGAVRATARKLGLATDASHRFERGVDPEGVSRAQETAARLLAELAGGTPAPGTVDVRSAPPEPRTLLLRLSRVERLLGYGPRREEVVAALDALGLAPAPESDETLRITVPSFRADLEREADLVEEVARHLGYQRIPPRLPDHGLLAGTSGPTRAEERTRDLLSHLGFHEAVTYSMVAEGEDDPFVAPETAPALALSNPIAENLSHLRRSILPGLLKALDRNLRRGNRDVRLFEVGRVFLAPDGETFPAEPVRVGIAWAGSGAPRHWSTPPREVEFHDLSGVVDAVIRALRPGAEVPRRPLERAGFHPGRSAAWTAPDGACVAWGGAIHPDVRQKLDLPAVIYLAEMDLTRLRELPGSGPFFRGVPRVPGASRDLSLVVPEEIPFSRLREVLAGVPAPAQVRFELVDRYRGAPLAEGQSGLTIRAILQPATKSLTEAEIEAYRKELILVLERDLGVHLR